MQQNQTIVIFEGHDQSGKTTIANELSARLAIPIFKIERTNTWWDPFINLRYATEAVTQFIEQTGVSVILDRWMGSDYMYDKLFDRHSDINKILNIDKRLAKLNAVIIICYKQPEYYTKDEKDGQLFKQEEYTKMTKLYEQYAEISNCRIFMIDTSDENLENQLKNIIAFI